MCQRRWCRQPSLQVQLGKSSPTSDFQLFAFHLSARDVTSVLFTAPSLCSLSFQIFSCKISLKLTGWPPLCNTQLTMMPQVSLFQTHISPCFLSLISPPTKYMDFALSSSIYDASEERISCTVLRVASLQLGTWVLFTLILVGLPQLVSIGILTIFFFSF